MLNRSILIGRLVADPELRYSGSGVAISSFRLAVDRPFSNQNREREVDFIPIVVFRQQAEHVANYLRKGRMAAVEGRIQVRNYDNNEGRRVYITEVVADNVRFLDKGESGQQLERQQPKSQDPFVDDGKPIDISDDDLPF